MPVTIQVNSRADFELSGSLHSTPDAQAESSVSLVFLSLTGGPIVGTSPSEVSESGSLDPGLYRLKVECSAFTPIAASANVVTSDAQISFTLSATSECDGDAFTWVGGRSGAFADAENWNPPAVPISEEGGRCDTAIVEGGRNVTIDLAAAAAAAARQADPLAARGPRAGARKIARLVVRESEGLRTPGGSLEVDALSPLLGERSLEIGQNSSLFLVGALIARHVALGAGGDGEIEVVGTAGLLETGGRLGLGADGAGRLVVRDGATVSSAESVLGELEANGSALVSGHGSLWSTANLAVGLEDDGALEIDAGGKVVSDQGVIGFNLDGDERGRVVVRGAEQNESRWVVDSLAVRARGSLLVDAFAVVAVTRALEVGAEGAAANCAAGAACVEVRGSLGASEAKIGSSGDGALQVRPDGTVRDVREHHDRRP